VAIAEAGIHIAGTPASLGSTIARAEGLNSRLQQ
jgi:hypothetical protein